MRLGTRREEGQTIVEFAFGIPVLLLVVTAIFSFGYALNNYLQLNDAVGAGALALAESRGSTDPCNQASSAAFVGAPFLLQSSLTFTYQFYDSTGKSTGGAAGTSCPSAAGYLVAGGTAQITMTYPATIAIYGANIFQGTMTAQTTETIQ